MATKQVKSTDNLPAVVAQGDYAVMQMDPESLREIIDTNLQGKIGPRDLDMIKAPGPGSVSWRIDTASGVEQIDRIEGVIVHKAQQRTYYEKAYKAGSSEPPNCYSLDMETGIGDPGGPCAKCPFNQFGTAKVGEGKACREYDLYFFLRPDDIMPTIVRVPPTSLKHSQNYMRQLVKAKPPAAFWQVVTEIRLAEADAGVAYAFRMVDRVQPDLLDKVRGLRAKFAGTKVGLIDENAGGYDPETGEIREAA